LLLIRWGRTSWEMILSALGFLRLCGINVDGIVMSHVAIRDTYYGQISGQHLIFDESSDRSGVSESARHH